MFQHLKKRRWAAPAFAVLLLLLALGAALVWRSRLNGTERALIGTWRRCGERQGQMTFTSDRQMVGDIPFAPGLSVRWRAADSMVWMWSEHQLPLRWNTLGTSFRCFLNPPDSFLQQTIEFDEQGRLRLTSPVGSFSMTST